MIPAELRLHHRLHFVKKGQSPLFKLKGNKVGSNLALLCWLRPQTAEQPLKIGAVTKLRLSTAACFRCAHCHRDDVSQAGSALLAEGHAPRVGCIQATKLQRLVEALQPLLEAQAELRSHVDSATAAGRDPFGGRIK